MLKIKVKNCYCRLEGEYPRNEINRVTSFSVQGAWFARAYKSGLWDGRQRLMHGDLFPTGLLNRIEEVLKLNKIKFEVEDLRIKPTVKFNDFKLNTIKLRDYQIEAIQEGLKKGRGVFALCTASGKSGIAAALIKAINKRAIIFTHRVNLLYQMKDFLVQYLDNPKIGIVGDNKWNIQDITVASVATLWSRIEETAKLYNYFDILIGDEIHKAGSTTWYKLMQKFDCYWRWGLSGTPLSRGDNRNLMVIAATGEPIYVLRSKELIEKGLSKIPIIEYVPIRADVEGATYSEIYENGIVKNELRNEKIVKKVKELINEDRQVMVFVRKINHGQILNKMLKEKNIENEFVYGNVNTEQRVSILKDFKEGRLKIVVSSVVWDEGIDAPALSGIILAGGGKSEIQALQRIGRGMRKHKRKDLRVIDFADFSHKYLANHSLGRLRTYKKEGFKIISE